MAQSTVFEENDEVIQLERSSLRREIAWLVHEEFPSTCEEIKAAVKACLSFIMPKDTNLEDQDPGNSYLKPIPFESQDKILKGSLAVSGWHVTDGEIEINFPKTANSKTNTATKTHVNPSEPWKLTQIQNSANFMRLALEELERIDRATEHYTRMDHFHAVLASKLIGRVSEHIKSASDQLLLPSRTTFLTSLHTQFTFKPPLPRELVLEFSVAHKMVLVSSYLLTPIATPKKGAAPSTKTTFFLRQQNQHFEIADQTQIECQSPLLDQLFDMIQLSYQLCAEYQEKLCSLASL
jgi:hypothetical protein